MWWRWWWWWENNRNVAVVNIEFHYLRSSVKKKVSVGSMWGRCGVDVGSMWGRCGIDVGSMWGRYICGWKNI